MKSILKSTGTNELISFEEDSGQDLPSLANLDDVGKPSVCGRLPIGSPSLNIIVQLFVALVLWEDSIEYIQGGDSLDMNGSPRGQSSSKLYGGELMKKVS